MNNSDDPFDPREVADLVQLWHDSLHWLFTHSLQILIASAFGAAIVALLAGAKWLGTHMWRADPDRNHWSWVIGKALARTRLWFMVAVAAHVVASYGHAPLDLAHTIQFLFVIAATLQTVIWIRALILGFVEHRAAGNASLGSGLHIIRLLVSIALFAVATISILSNLGVNVTGLIAGLGIGGIAIGLAAQGIFKDLFAALSILFDRPFVVNDLIKFGDVLGRVEAIGLKTTRVRSLDGEEVIMSNDKLLDQQIRNFHGIESWRIVLHLPLHYANAAEKLAALPNDLAAKIGEIADCRFDHALLTSFDANAVMLELMLHSTKGDADVRDRVRHQAMIATLSCITSEGLRISYRATENLKPDVVKR